MDIVQFTRACNETLQLLKGRAGDFDARRDTGNPTSPWHMFWMLDSAIAFYAEDKVEKANRWLGYVQGVMAAMCYASLEELKRANMPPGEVFDGEKL